ncbi:MAG: hypothetical protein IKW15_09145, partial [Bacteroidales bacterium]|nr:hypothetical protein [Bacteroidales bacterium]
MEKFAEDIKIGLCNAGQWLLKRRTAVLFALAVVLAVLSCFAVPSGIEIQEEAARLEKKVQTRQGILQGYVQRALEVPVDEWMRFDDLPHDMVIYRYNADTLQSWANQFPVANDEVDVLTLWYRINHLNSRSLFNAPLAYLTEQEQYVNLGSAWYVVKVYRKDAIKIISGLLIKTEYLSNNTILASRINPELDVKKRRSIAPVTFDEGAVVKGLDGGALFSLGDELRSDLGGAPMSLRWMAMLLFCAAMYSFIYSRRTFKVLGLYLLGLTGVRVICFGLTPALRFSSELFSPTLYADVGLFSSFGNFLLNNLYVSLVALGVYLLRKKILHLYTHCSEWTRKVVLALSVVFVVAQAFYINYVFVSLINNSSIVLELYRLEELSIYSIVAYTSYAMLFVGLLFTLQMVLPMLPFVKRHSVLRPRNLLIYIAAISLYTMLVVGSMGFRKEQQVSKVWANKLAV